jgi:serine/threonine protein kinase
MDHFSFQAASEYLHGTYGAVHCPEPNNANGANTKREPLDRKQLESQTWAIKLQEISSADSNVMFPPFGTHHHAHIILGCHIIGRIVSNGTLGQTQTACMAIDDDAVEHCHILRIYHRDLKPENILVPPNVNRHQQLDPYIQALGAELDEASSICFPAFDTNLKL